MIGYNLSIALFAPYGTRPAIPIALCLLAAGGLFGCSDGGHALLLEVRGQAFVETFDLTVRDLGNKQLVLERRGEPVDANDPNRDISQAGKELRLAIEFSNAGNYLVHFIGYGSDAAQVALRPFEVRGVERGYLRLVLLGLGMDDDHDGYVACGAYSDCGPNSPIDCKYLDCDDTDASVYPYAEELCGNGRDDDCSAGCNAAPGEGDGVCEDGDGDGAIGADDCDDTNPCRAPSIREAANLCGASPADFVLPQACLDYLQKEGITPPEPPFCGDGVDQSCGGQDVPCQIDEDCDTYPPPVDCDDQNPNVNPGATEACDDDIDNNCDGKINEGCAPCDVDGDGHAASGVRDPNCKGSDGLPLPTDDPDDYDAGIYTGSSAGQGGAEGGHVTGALREVCSRTKRNRDNDKFEAEVDHDGDGQPAAADGCPSVACDGDGDGFPAASCNIPNVEPDCDDSDPHTFPGAPERCNDGIDQSCSGSDLPCDEDNDGDGYPASEDCIDDPAHPSAAITHPWAVEICDGIDNDCDGLVDEGNPNDLGESMSSGVSCTDDNDGVCGKTRGRCACSSIPFGALDENDNRDACRGEDLSPGARSPRCVGAGQPGLERCDDEDRDCNGHADDPQGENLAEVGLPCGVARGSCTLGQVAGCDLSASVPNLDLVRAQQGNFNPHWICRKADGSLADLPIPEVCNGKDDDCDGTIPNRERDDPPVGDGDGYLACSGCTSGSGRSDLDPRFRGCDDCAANNGNVFPTQAELCNGIDDNCSDSINDDGAGECTPTQLCCATGCKSVQTDANNCGDCGVRCSDQPRTDRCVGGECVCGNTGAPCPPSSDPCSINECINGSCRAAPVPNCCTNASECNDGDFCTTDDCQNNRCTHDWIPRCCHNDADCVDNDPCTTGVCNTGQNKCKTSGC